MSICLLLALYLSLCPWSTNTWSLAAWCWCWMLWSMFEVSIDTEVTDFSPASMSLDTRSQHHSNVTTNSATATCRTVIVILSEWLYSVSQKNPPCGFLIIFSKRFWIFNQFFTHLLRVPFYTRWQIYIQLFPTLMKLCHTKRDHPANFYISLER